MTLITKDEAKTLYIDFCNKRIHEHGIRYYITNSKGAFTPYLQHHVSYERFGPLIMDNNWVNLIVLVTPDEHDFLHYLLGIIYPDDNNAKIRAMFSKKHILVNMLKTENYKPLFPEVLIDMEEKYRLSRLGVLKGRIPKWREELNRRITIATQTPEYRNKMRELALERWANNEYYTKNINKILENGKNTRFTSEQIVAKWNNPEYKEKQLKIVLEAGKNTRFKSGIRNNPKGEFTSEEVSKRNIKNWQNSEYRERMSKQLSNSAKLMWKPDPIKGKKIRVTNGIVTKIVCEPGFQPSGISVS